ncbi:MAG: hypothetical protein V1767_01290 [Chloroflexota bacterium]
MKSIKWAVIYGLIVWAIPFVVAILIFPLRTSDRPFFESIMPVAVVAATVLCGALYFKKVESAFLKEGVLLGLVFLVISLVIDLLMFSRGPMAMPLADYVTDIGFTYLLIPMITFGMGYILKRKLK